MITGGNDYLRGCHQLLHLPRPTPLDSLCRVSLLSLLVACSADEQSGIGPGLHRPKNHAHVKRDRLPCSSYELTSPARGTRFGLKTIE